MSEKIELSNFFEVFGALCLQCCLFTRPRIRSTGRCVYVGHCELSELWPRDPVLRGNCGRSGRDGGYYGNGLRRSLWYSKGESISWCCDSIDCATGVCVWKWPVAAVIARGLTEVTSRCGNYQIYFLWLNVWTWHKNKLFRICRVACCHSVFNISSCLLSKHAEAEI
jgi:hypothetical protein